MNNQIQFPLNNAQIELLKVFDKKLDESEMKELKAYLLELKFKKFQKLVDSITTEKNYTEKDFESISKEHLRTPYKSNILITKKKGEGSN